MSKFIFISLITGLFLQANIANAETAQDNYRTYCMQCHGLKGTGMGLNIQDMSVQPRNHTDAKAMSARADSEIFKAIKEGGLAISKSSLMPQWGDVLDDHEINDLVKHIRTLCNCKSKVK